MNRIGCILIASLLLLSGCSVVHTSNPDGSSAWTLNLGPEATTAVNDAVDVVTTVGPMLLAKVPNGEDNLTVAGPAKKVTQNADQWAYTQSGGDLLIHDIRLNQGCLVRSIGGNSLTVQRVQSDGAPKGGGKYFIVVATGPGRTVLLDNTGLKNAWIFNGGEAAIRIMGRTKKSTIVGFDLCCRKHDLADGGSGKLLCPIPKINPDGSLVQPKGQHLDWWKQVLQLRDIDDGQMSDSRIVGPWDIGQQEDANSPQCVKHFAFINCGFSHEPHFTNYNKSWGVIERKNCYKIGEDGKPLLDNHGKRIMWADQTWVGAKGLEFDPNMN